MNRLVVVLSDWRNRGRRSRSSDGTLRLRLHLNLSSWVDRNGSSVALRSNSCESVRRSLNGLRRSRTSYCTLRSSGEGLLLLLELNSRLSLLLTNDRLLLLSYCRITLIISVLLLSWRDVGEASRLLMLNRRIYSEK